MNSYKNITKKDISLIIDGKRINIKPNQTINGPDTLANYRGLIKLNKKINTINTPDQVLTSDYIIEIDEYDFNIENNKANFMNRIDLSDVTFTIPLSIESEDRKNNIITTVDYLCRYFKTNIFIGEVDKVSKIKSIWKPEWEESCKLFFLENTSNFFYKTKILNELAKKTKTPIIVSYDCDVLLYPQAYIDATNEIRSGSTDFCYPFNRPLRHIEKNSISYFKKVLDLNIVETSAKVTNAGIPPGGCFFMNRSKFFEAGMENEKMISWGPEDQERLARVKALGYNVKSLPYDLFHLDHEITFNSFYTNPFYSKNVAEFEKVCKMSKEQLSNYVKTFNWVSQ